MGTVFSEENAITDSVLPKKGSCVLIEVFFQNNQFGMIKPLLLDKLISADRIKKFRRSEGWATIGIDPIRGTGGYYSGRDRRNKSV